MMAEHKPNAEIQTVTNSTFTPLVLERERAIVVEFMSYGCSHCRVLEPVLRQVSDNFRIDSAMWSKTSSRSGV